jgi:hypothetical protein
MAETKVYTFDYKEVIEALIKKQDIHEGLWVIYMEFGLGGGHVPGPVEDSTVPAAIVPVLKIGIQRSDKPSAGTVDAAEVNPSTPSRKRVKKKV